MSGRDRRDSMIRLVKGAALAHMTYQQMHNAALRHEVRAYQDSNGRWWVHADDAKKLGRAREPAPTGT